MMTVGTPILGNLHIMNSLVESCMKDMLNSSNISGAGVPNLDVQSTWLPLGTQKPWHLTISIHFSSILTQISGLNPPFWICQILPSVGHNKNQPSAGP